MLLCENCFTMSCRITCKDLTTNCESINEQQEVVFLRFSTDHNCEAEVCSNIQANQSLFIIGELQIGMRELA